MSSRQHFKISLPMKIMLSPIRLLNRLGQVERVAKMMNYVIENSQQNHFADYKLSNTDVVIATLARSGTHWMMQIVLQIAYRGQADYDYIYDLVSWPEYFPNGVLPLSEDPPPSPTG